MDDFPYVFEYINNNVLADEWLIKFCEINTFFRYATYKINENNFLEKITCTCVDLFNFKYMYWYNILHKKEKKI